MTTVVLSEVVLAVYTHHRDHAAWPTTQEVAALMEVDIPTARRQLGHLERETLFRQRTRDGRRVWMPWGLT